MTAPLQLTFVMSADTVDGLPPSPAEVAVWGRSNVGKSSLVNALAQRRALARTSRTPGRTQLLNCFSFPQGGTFLDLPGYGYAKAPVTVRDEWQRRTATYLQTRRPLVRVLLLVDGKVGPTRLDLDQLTWLRRHQLPTTVIAVKQDAVIPSRRTRRARELAEPCGLAPDDVLWVSAHTGTNVVKLRDLIRGWVGA